MYKIKILTKLLFVNASCSYFDGSVNDTLLRPTSPENEQHKGRMKIEESDKNGAKHEVYEEFPNVLKDYYSDSDCEERGQD